MRRAARSAWLSMIIAAVLVLPVRAQTQIIETWVDHAVGEWVTFYARVTADEPIETALVFFQAHQDTHTGVGKAVIKKLNPSTYLFSYTHNIQDYYLRPFSNVDYRWEIVTEGGEKHRSQAYQFFYDDNRFRWNSLEEGVFRVHWYNDEAVFEDSQMGVEFAQSVIDTAQMGFTSAQSYLPLPLPRPPQRYEIYVYSSSSTLQGILSPNSQEWVAGHADPDLGVIVAALPPGPDRAMLVQQRVPHEMMHVLLYQYAEPGYANLPAWLSEGLASLVELYPNSDYDYLLKQAVAEQSLIPFTSMCNTFPREASGALQAYAQSVSFTRYLHSVYGVTGMEALVRAYANGLDCERGAREAFGRSLQQLERNWRSDVLAENLTASAVNNLLPWAGLAALIFAMPTMLILAALWRRR